jgi:hypothetical protein
MRKNPQRFKQINPAFLRILRLFAATFLPFYFEIHIGP